MDNQLQITRYPTDYSLTDITLITAQKNISLKPLMVELNFFEDLYSPSISGELIVSDALGILNNYKVNGTEFISIEFKKDYSDPKPISKLFRVYKVGNRTPDGVNMYENYNISFCSEELLVSEKYRISKSYRNKKISEIVKDVFDNFLSSGKKITAEETIGLYDFVLPNKKVFETINWLTTYAQPATNNLGADMLFYENAEGYNLKSLQTLFSQKSVATYYYNPKNVTIDMQQKYMNLMDFEVIESFDTLNATSSGTFSNRVLSLDTLLRKKTVTDFNYKKYFDTSKKLNKYKVSSDYKNKMGDAMYDAPDDKMESAPLRLVVGNSEERKSKIVKQTPRGVKNDYFIEKTLPYRVAQINLANYTRVKVVAPGNPKMTVGSVIDLNMFSMQPISQNTRREKDNFYSGNYLVSAVRHIIQQGSYITVMELTKDSYMVDVPAINSNTTQWNKLTKGY